MKKTFAFIVRLLVVLSVALPMQMQRVAAQGVALVDSAPLSWIDAKQREPRLMSEAETAKVFAHGAALGPVFWLKLEWGFPALGFGSYQAEWAGMVSPVSMFDSYRAA